MPPTDHRTAELRSIAMHELIAARLDDASLARAQARVDRWEREGALHPTYARRWRELLARPRPELRAALVADDEAMRDLRQCTPFAGELPAADRWRIIRETA